MAVAVPLRRPDPPAGPSSAQDIVVRVDDLFGPISPELALVDPELAPRARALLPEFPGIRFAARAKPAPHAPLRRAAGVFDRRDPRMLAGVAVVIALALAVVGAAVLAGGGHRQPTTSAASAPRVTTPPPVRQPSPKAKPTPSRAPATAGGAAITPPRFVWPVVPRVSGYRVALFRGGAQVFEQDVTVPALALSQSWTYQGRFHRLQRGAYRWIVWPLFGKGTATRTGPPIVSAQYVV
jgi:hypothetical protein